jgi:hypothetical protein
LHCWSHISSPFRFGYFRDGVPGTFCSGWHGTKILLISVSQVARIIGVSHWYPTSWFIVKFSILELNCHLVTKYGFYILAMGASFSGLNVNSGPLKYDHLFDSEILQICQSMDQQSELGGYFLTESLIMSCFYSYCCLYHFLEKAGDVKHPLRIICVLCT